MKYKVVTEHYNNILTCLTFHLISASPASPVQNVEITKYANLKYEIGVSACVVKQYLIQYAPA